MTRMIAFVAGIFLLLPAGLFASQGEGTRHISGSDMDLYFMDDKVFGTADGHPLWSIYNCGTDIVGAIDINGTYHDLNFTYHRDGDQLITGTFGAMTLAMGKIEKTADGLVYHVVAGETPLRFTIRYDRQEDGHLVNSIIEGSAGEGRPIRLVVDGRLCPFATTGIIMIAVGAALADDQP
ncbi:MAG: hypothetical protein KQI78_20420 [Deltaproteobacteria bacterium]|nr:hypothetical protein [Deltaproteobacteria bacterium]